MDHEPRSFKVQGRVTENIINQMEQARILDINDNESMQVNRALELMYNKRNKTSKFENNVVASMAKSSLLDMQTLQNRVNMRQIEQDLLILVELTTLKIRVYPNTETTKSDIRDLARIIYDIKAYSEENYKICYNMALKLLKKGQKTIFQSQIIECIRVSPSIHIVGGTLDEYTDDVSDLVNNCMTVPKNHKEAKISDTLHYITQNFEDSSEMCEVFLNAIERKEHENK